MEFNKTEKRKRTVSTMGYKNYYFKKQDGESPRILSIVNTIFKKTFTINGNEKYTLPKPELMFIENPSEIEELQKIKKDLNETKSKLNNYCISEWHQHTSQRNKAKDVEWRVRRDFDPEFVTQAWCKFHEIVSKYPLVPKENIFSNNNTFLSLHLCEAPGAFVTCLNHWLKTNVPTVHWDWLAMTFNPYYEGNSNTKMINDDRFMMHTLGNWYFGKDYTGNLMALENLDALIEKVKLKGKVNLITADGSVNCTHDPGEQEGIVASLHFCEVVAAMHILEANGNFLLKIFTVFEHQSICLIYFLSCVFNKIHFYKPVTSKEGNSETYIICLGFKGSKFVLPYLPVIKKEYGKTSTTAMFRKIDIPESFIEQIISCAQVFKNHQCEVIENNISAYNDIKNGVVGNYEEKKIAKLVADKYVTDFPLQRLHMDLQIVGNFKLKKMKNIHWVDPPADSFNERQKKQLLKPVHKLLIYIDQLKSLEPVPKNFIYKPLNLYSDSCINVGKPYQRIQSSQFCSMHMLEIYKLLFQVVDMENDVQICLPTKESIVEYECEMQQLSNNTYKSIYFQYTEICDNNKTISCIKQTLINLQMGDNLILFGYLLLTQFNVGLIYLLSHTFEGVEFIANEKIGCSVVLKNFRKIDLILQKLEQIYKVVEFTDSNNTTVLSVISVTELCGSELYSMILRLNTWIAKYCGDYIASVYNGHKGQNLLEE